MPELLDMHYDGLETIQGRVVGRVIIRVTHNESAPVTLVGYCRPDCCGPIINDVLYPAHTRSMRGLLSQAVQDNNDQ